MVRRRTPGRDRQLTHREAMDEIRRLGALNDPTNPEWDELRDAAVRAIASKKLVGMDLERAAKIYDVLRANPALIPPPEPAEPGTGHGSDL